MGKRMVVIAGFITAMLVVVILAEADVPQLISFQGKLYDDTGNPLTGKYEITFRIYDAESNGTELWSETDSVDCEDGLYNIILGLMTALNPDFDGQYWLGVQVTGDDELSPRYRLVSVPTAFRVQVANSAEHISWTNLTDVPAGFADGIDDVGEVGGISQIDAGTCIEVTSPTGPTVTVAHAADATALPDAHHAKTTNASELNSGRLDNARLNMGHGNGIDADMVDGQHASDFLSTANDWGRSGVATDLYEGTTTLTDKYVNETGPEEMTGSSSDPILEVTNNGSGFSVKGEHSSSSNVGYLGTSGHGVYGEHGSSSNIGYLGSSDYGVYYYGGLGGSGTNSCIVKTSKGPTLLYFQESAENWFEDFGEGQLSGGRCHIELDPLFLETVTIDDRYPMKVFIQLNGDCNGTYVERGRTGFYVIELQGGQSNARFTYRVVAKRSGFEEKRLDVCEFAKKDPYLYPEMKDTMDMK